jgi:hypothetical protein
MIEQNFFVKRLGRIHEKTTKKLKIFVDFKLYPFHPFDMARNIDNVNLMYNIQLHDHEWQILYEQWFQR